jgi:hypothetical protein
LKKFLLLLNIPSKIWEHTFENVPNSKPWHVRTGLPIKSIVRYRKVARQQCQGEIQLPLSDLGAIALDYRGFEGMATSIGHAPQAAMIDPAAGSILAVAEALTNIVFAPRTEGLKAFR